jgi:hypothetical protein
MYYFATTRTANNGAPEGVIPCLITLRASTARYAQYLRPPELITFFRTVIRLRGWMAGLALAGIAMAVTGYGYWHAATHATFDVHLAYRAAAGAAAQLRNGQIEFLDDGGIVLARASIDTKFGVVWLAHPDKGQCGPDLAPGAFQECFSAQAVWIPQWVRRVRYANIALQRCSLARRTVQLTTYRDNLLLWWLPLPHVGGKPYTRYSATVAIDTKGCGK